VIWAYLAFQAFQVFQDNLVLPVKEVHLVTMDAMALKEIAAIQAYQVILVHQAKWVCQVQKVTKENLFQSMDL